VSGTQLQDVRSALAEVQDFIRGLDQLSKQAPSTSDAPAIAPDIWNGGRAKDALTEGLPPLSKAMQQVIDTSVSLSRVQLQQFFQEELQQVPLISDVCDAHIGSYVVGLVTGGMLQTKADIAWAKGDDDLAHLGWYVSVAAAHFALFGERSLAVADLLPQLGGSLTLSGPLEILDQAGGADGMAAAQGEALPEGGYLLRYLTCNIGEDELRKAGFAHLARQ
jgi:hypothetical protein